MNLHEFWPECQRRLRQSLSAQQYQTWITRLAVAEEDGAWMVYAESKFKCDWVRKNFWAQIEAVKNELAADAPPLVLAIGEERHFQAAADVPAAEARPAAAVVRESALAIVQKYVRDTAPADQPAAAASAGEKAPAKAVHNLQAEFTFDTLVVGKGNEVAVAVARNIAEQPGGDYNPFYLYSSPGLGKTHLVQAIGHALLRAHPRAKVAYMHADDYVRSLMNAAKKQAFDTFKQQYKQYDLLILDDVQFIAGKERTMEEFFYLFNHFQKERKQLILTGDKLPNDIDEMDVRLKTRFNSGLSLRLEPPELEMRVAILQKKAELAGTALDEAAAFFIAKHIKGSVRDLEGAFKRVDARSRFTGRAVDIDLVREALQDLVASSHRVMTAEGILETVSKYYGISMNDLTGKRRLRNIARPRQIAMTLMKELTALSLPAIGQHFGCNHTTVLHGVKTIAQKRREEAQLEQDYQKLLILIKS